MGPNWTGPCRHWGSCYMCQELARFWIWGPSDKCKMQKQSNGIILGGIFSEHQNFPIQKLVIWNFGQLFRLFTTMCVNCKRLSEEKNKGMFIYARITSNFAKLARATGFIYIFIYLFFAFYTLRIFAFYALHLLKVECISFQNNSGNFVAAAHNLHISYYILGTWSVPRI